MNANNEVTGVPVNSLAGVISLSSLLHELPLPQPRPETAAVHKSLLFHPQVAQASSRVLASGSNDPDLVDELLELLSKTSSSHIVLKDEYNYNENVDIRQVPPLLQAVLTKDPYAFSGGSRAHLNQQQYGNYSFQQPPGQYGFTPGQMPQQNGQVGSNYDSNDVGNDDYRSRPSSSGNQQTAQKRESMRMQIVSIGKQPKVNSRKRKDMVSELFDSLTPGVEYFADNTRRRRPANKAYTDEEYETNPNVGQEESESEEGGKVRRRGSKHAKGDEEYSAADRPLTPDEIIEEREKEWQVILKKRKEKLKRRNERMLAAPIDPDELVELECYRKFMNAMESVFDNIEEYDMPPPEGGDEEEIPAEWLIPKCLLTDLCSEAQKLKVMRAMNRVPIKSLVKLIGILEKNIKDGARLMPLVDEKEADDETLREIMFERVLRSADAAIVAVTIMTSPGMPKLVYLEDTIERSVGMARSQLSNAIFPAFDPLYRVDKKSDQTPSSKAKRNKGGTKNKSVSQLYNKMIDLVGILADLVEMQMLTDTSILQLSTLGVSTFFVENVSEIQLNALRLISNIFSKYDKHRQVIMDDILASLSRLPSGKKNMRTYRLGSEEYIQMVTALVMQLIQSVVFVPGAAVDNSEEDAIDQLLTEIGPKHKKKDTANAQDQDVAIVTSYEAAMRCANTFLLVYLKKCNAKTGDDDYRPLFEAFVEDLLAAVNKPEWPAAELLLSLLGSLLVSHFSNKSIDVTLRVASLDYLGVVASRLRKDAVSSQFDAAGLSQIIHHLTKDPDDDGRLKKEEEPSEDKLQILQRALTDYLIELSENDPSLEFARKFYIAQWYRDASRYLEKKSSKSPKKGKKNSSKSSSFNEDSDDSTDTSHMTEEEKHQLALQKASATKQFLLTLVDRNQETGIGSKLHQLHNMLNDESAAFVVRYLASKRPFSQSFDVYLSQILRVLNETAVAVRTKAMKCLTAVVEADPAILERNDIEQSVHARLLDSSANVREAAVDLLGKFILIRPNLIRKYYLMLLDRILDTGVSVRKRVIKILKDICIEQPDFDKIPEICVRMIRRVGDEEGIRKLVNEVFHSLWFVPVKERDTATLMKKVVNITDVVASCRDTGYEWFESLLVNLLKKDADKQALTACKQIIKCLVDNILTLEEKLIGDEATKAANHQRLLSCLTTLFLFSKVKPSLMVAHIEIMQPYLCMNCQTLGEQAVLVQVIKIIEMVMPLMDHPSEAFLTQIEENLIKLIFKFGQQVVQAGIACLAAVVNNITKNHEFVQNAFFKLFNLMSKIQIDLEAKAQSYPTPNTKPSLLRSLFTLGLFCRYFDIDSHLPANRKTAISFKDRVFESFLFFNSLPDEDVKLKALVGLGFFCVSHCQYFVNADVRSSYCEMLKNPHTSVKLKVQILQNIELYLKEEELKMVKGYEEWSAIKDKDKGDLKEMGDVTSGMASTIIQLYLKDVLEAFFHADSSVRIAAANAVMLTLQQGLVHPVQCIPYLIAMGTEPDATIRARSDNMLKEIDSKHTGFIQMAAISGVRESFRLQKLLRTNKTEVVRGVRAADEPQALNAYLYTIVRGSRQYRRGLLQSLLKLFEDMSKTSLEELFYVADNLANFPYQSQDEPLYVVHNVDMIVSVSGSGLLQTFKEHLMPKTFVNPGEVEDEDEETVEELYARLPPDSSALEDLWLTSSEGFLILLQLKNFLKDCYGFTDSKIQVYNPSVSAKVYDKAVVRKSGVKFEPRFTANQLISDRSKGTDLYRRKLCEQFVEFKQLVMSIDNSGQSGDDQNDEDYQAGPSMDHSNPQGKRKKFTAAQSCGEQVYAGADMGMESAGGSA